MDKTGLIGNLLNTRKAKVTLITRPRRFGKTQGMNMLANFFNISKDYVLCEQWINQYPTLFLSFKDVDGLCFDNAIIRSFIDYSGPSISEKLELMLSVGYIVQTIEEDLTYDYLHSSEDNL